MNERIPTDAQSSVRPGTGHRARLLLTLISGVAAVMFALVLLQIWHAGLHTSATMSAAAANVYSPALRVMFELAGVIGLIGLIACVIGAAECYVLVVRERDRTELERATERSERSERKLQQISAEVETLHARLITSGLREPVTGLPNRKACLEAIDRTLARMRQSSGRNVAVLALGFDKLQRVADAYGYSMVDRLLLEAARRVEQLLEPQDFLSRIGDTQLALVVTDVSDANGAATLANLIGDALRQPCEVDGRRFHLDHCIGVACADSGHEYADQILDHAMLAMHETRENSAQRVQVFQARSADELEKRLQLEADLRHAIDREEFVLWYQPVFEGVSTGVAGFEALLRWNHPREGLVLPGQFLGIAHEMGLMADITHWLLREVARQAAQWQNQIGDRFFISANLTADSFSDPGLVGEIAELLVEYQIPARRLKLEIVETTVVADVTTTARLISALRDLGVVVWLDDFGTGYSSLSYLRALAFQGVKLDRSFVARMAADSRDFGLVKSIIDLLHYLEMSCVAEGVETPEQRDLLKMAGCDLFQGYLLARPMPAAEAGKLLPSNIVRLASAASG